MPGITSIVEIVSKTQVINNNENGELMYRVHMVCTLAILHVVIVGSNYVSMTSMNIIFNLSEDLLSLIVEGFSYVN